MISSDNRPIYLNLLRIKLPLPGIISIMHRAFGVLLSFSIPFVAYFFARSLESEQAFEDVKSVLQNGFLIPIYILLLWSFLHHFFAGIRYLLIDVEIGVSKGQSQKSSLIVVVAGVLATLIIVAGALL